METIDLDLIWKPYEPDGFPPDHYRVRLNGKVLPDKVSRDVSYMELPPLTIGPKHSIEIAGVRGPVQGPWSKKYEFSLGAPGVIDVSTIELRRRHAE